MMKKEKDERSLFSISASPETKEKLLLPHQYFKSNLPWGKTLGPLLRMAETEE